VRSTLGYLLLLPKAPISWLDRILCFGVLCRYVLQVSKWKRIFVNTLRDEGITDGYLQLPQAKVTTEIRSGAANSTPRSSVPVNSA
jgi:hypothetical protein